MVIDPLRRSYLSRVVFSAGGSLAGIGLADGQSVPAVRAVPKAPSASSGDSVSPGTSTSGGSVCFRLPGEVAAACHSPRHRQQRATANTAANKLSARAVDGLERAASNSI